MFEKLNHKIFKWGSSNIPWTNVYGLARSIMAISTALTLALNKAQILFKPASGISEYPMCNGNISIFCTVPNSYIYLNLIRWLCVILLIIVASGWRPRITGVIHWWIAYSLQVSALTIDGGEQVAAVFTLLLIPITLTDPRKWHWETINKDDLVKNKRYIYSSILALTTFFAIRLQAAILYFDSAVEKLKDPEWINGTAVYYYVQQPMLCSVPACPDTKINFLR